MASTAAYNDKTAPVYSPASAHRAAPSAPVYDPDIPYAVQVDTVAPPPPQHAPPATFSVVHLPPAPSAQPPPQVAMQPAVNDWQVSLFGCCGAPAHCCMSFVFPCVNAGYAAHWIGWSGLFVGLFTFVTYTGAVVLSSGPSADGKSWFTHDSYSSDDDNVYTKWDGFATLCGLAFLLATTALRRAVRTFDRIPGSTITDFCASFWCSCCVLAQLSSHTERMKPHRSANASTLPAYSAA